MPKTPSSSRSKPPAHYPFLRLSDVERYVPAMELQGVSEVARSPRGFLIAYRAAGSAGQLSERWHTKRTAFIARHMAQVLLRQEPLYTQAGEPTRRHLALIAWAYSPG